MLHLHPRRVLFFALLSAGCSNSERQDDAGDLTGLVFRADVQPVTRVEDAKRSVFIPPFVDCRDPKPGETGQGPGGKVCTNVAISGCTEPGKYYPDYASCDVVRTQRPFWQEPPARVPPTVDPRLQDATYLGEASWAKEQIAACACTCCHDARSFAGKTGQWDIDHGPLWLDTLSDNGLALFAGLADSSVLGAYSAIDNHGFDRTITGIPTTDTPRMKAFTTGELQRRGISTDQARAVPPFGGPIYTNRVTPPSPCKAGEGVDETGRIFWQGAPARYVYVMAAESDNPGVPPNLDLPPGTLFRLDVLASAAAVASGIFYGQTPPGTFQFAPDRRRAPALVAGTAYHLYALQDVGIPVANCLFTFGAPLSSPTPPPGSGGATGAGGAVNASGGYPAATGGAGGVPQPGSGGAIATGGAPQATGGIPQTGSGGSPPTGTGGAPAMCSLPGGDTDGFGATCTDATNSSDCTCAASYCAVQPGSTAGFCSRTGCKENPSLCPSGWSCFDLSVFGAGLPSFCNKP